MNLISPPISVLPVNITKHGFFRDMPVFTPHTGPHRHPFQHKKGSQKSLGSTSGLVNWGVLLLWLAVVVFGCGRFWPVTEMLSHYRNLIGRVLFTSGPSYWFSISTYFSTPPGPVLPRRWFEGGFGVFWRSLGMQRQTKLKNRRKAYCWLMGN